MFEFGSQYNWRILERERLQKRNEQQQQQQKNENIIFWRQYQNAGKQKCHVLYFSFKLISKILENK